MTVVRCDERFTLWLNADGQPVEKPLSAMTSGELLAAVEWHHAETERLQREAAPYAAMAEGLKQGIEPSLTKMEWLRGCWALEAAGKAANKERRLMQLLIAAMPQWPKSGLTFGQAVKTILAALRPRATRKSEERTMACDGKNCSYQGQRFEIEINGSEYTAWRDCDGMILGIDVRPSPVSRNGEPLVIWKRGQSLMRGSMETRVVRALGIRHLITRTRARCGGMSGLGLE